MTPIRIGFIGLSANGGWGPSAHWPYLKQTDKYQVVAVCNSSVESSEKAKTHFGLPESTKSYGSPKDLAADPNVDLVVCGVRVDEHYAAIKPALEAKKAVYCEWPLGANVEEAHELADLAKGGKSMVGLQARQAPVILQVRELVESKRFGKVLSSAVVSSGGNFGPTESVKMKYFNDKKVGGNMVGSTPLMRKIVLYSSTHVEVVLGIERRLTDALLPDVDPLWTHDRLRDLCHRRAEGP